MTVEKWEDGGNGSPGAEPTWPIHDRIAGIQATTLTMLMNPTTLRRVYDNEFLVPADQDALTLPELIDTISSAVWTELDKAPAKTATNREPLISSLRRNLQQEHIERLIDLSLEGGSNAAGKTIATLATAKLRELNEKIGKTVEKGNGRVDGYTSAHLAECKQRISKALEAHYVYNAGGSASAFPGFFFKSTPPAEPTGRTGGEGGEQH
jgi:hypothetical protein